jgi:hypothetical protein
MPDTKYVFQLIAGGRCAAVIAESPDEARRRALIMDPMGPWLAAETPIISRVPSTMTTRILALERK